MVACDLSLPFTGEWTLFQENVYVAMRLMKTCMRKIWVPIISLVIAVSLASFATYELAQINQQSLLDYNAPAFTTSQNVTEFTLNLYLSPSYFEPRGQLYFAASSPYINYLKEFNMSASLDGENWTEINVSQSPPSTSDRSGYTYLGFVDLTQLKITVYGEYYLPPQSGLPANVSEQDVQDSFRAYVWIDPFTTPYDLTLIAIVFVSILGASFSILSAFLPVMIRTGEKSRTATVGGQIKARPGAHPTFVRLADTRTGETTQITFADGSGGNPKNYAISVAGGGSYQVSVGWAEQSGASGTADFGVMKINGGGSVTRDFSV